MDRRLTGMLRALAPGLVLWLLLVLALPALFTGRGYVPWDATDLWLPWKHFITECLWNGAWPLWNPSILHGFPQGGDPGTWYPVSWLFALPGRYDLTAMNAEYLFHLWFAGMGFRLLALRLAMPRATALALAACYMFSGLMLGNAQHIGWVVSAAWTPWVLAALLHLYRRPGPVGAAALALALAMSLAGGYVGMFIVQGYLLAGLAVAGIARRWRQGGAAAVRPWAGHLALAALLFVPAAAAVLASSTELAAHVDRGAGLRPDATVTGVLNGSLPPKALLTFFVPLLTGVADPAFFGRDLALVNCTIGLLPVMAVLYGMVHRPGRRYLVFLVAGVAMLMLAIGEDLPFRRWAYHLPLLDLFRFPTIFRMFAILFLLLAAGEVLRTPPHRAGGWWRWLAAGAIVMAAIAGAQWAGHGAGALRLVPRYGPDAFHAAASLSDRLLLGCGVGAVVLGAAAWACRARAPVTAWALPVLIMADATVAARLCAPDTVRHTGATTAQVDAFIAACPPTVPLPPLDRPLSAVDDTTLRHNMLWRNLAMFHKLPTGDGWSPYHLLAHAAARGEGAIDAVQDRPLAYWDGPADTGATVHGVAAGVGMFAFRASSVSGGTLALLQNRYPGWRATVNGARVPVHVHRTAFMAVELPPGAHEVCWEFRPRPVRAAAWTSVLAWCVLGTGVLMAWARRRGIGRRRAGPVLASGALLLGLWCAWVYHQRHAGGDLAARRAALERQVAALPAGTTVQPVANTDRPLAPGTAAASHVRTVLPTDMGELARALRPDADHVAYIRAGTVRWPEESAILLHGHRVLAADERGGITTLLLERTDDRAAAPLLLSMHPRPGAEETGTVLRRAVGSLAPGRAIEVFVEAGPVGEADPYIALQVERGGAIIDWHAYPVRAYGTGPRVRAWAVADLRNDLRADDVLSVFLWQGNEHAAHLYDLRIGQRPSGGAWTVPYR